MHKPTQQQLDTFVHNHIIYNQTSLVQELFKRNVFDLDHITNFWYNPCTECGGEIKNISTLNDELYECENCNKNFAELEYDEIGTEAKEVYEWWLCDDWLLEQLEKQGEPILKTDFQNWWGRQSTGQAIALDSVIEKIYIDNNL